MWSLYLPFPQPRCCPECSLNWDIQRNINLAFDFEHSRQWHQAAHHYSLAANLAKTDPNLYIKAAQLYELHINFYGINAKLLATAADHYIKAAELTNDPNLHIKAANLYDGCGEKQQAAHNFARAAALYEVKQELENAAINYNIAANFKLNPELYKRAAEAYRSCKQLEKAAMFFKKAAGWYNKQGKKDQATYCKMMVENLCKK